jgi:uncharacterized protein YcbX
MRVSIADQSNQEDMKDANYQDEYPISVITNGTIEFLLQKHIHQFDLNRVRVKLIINDNRAHIEDSKEYITINGQQLIFIVSISGCPVISVNPNDSNFILVYYFCPKNKTL